MNVPAEGELFGDARKGTGPTEINEPLPDPHAPFGDPPIHERTLHYLKGQAHHDGHADLQRSREALDDCISLALTSTNWEAALGRYELFVEMARRLERAFADREPFYWPDTHTIAATPNPGADRRRTPSSLHSTAKSFQTIGRHNGALGFLNKAMKVKRTVTKLKHLAAAREVLAGGVNIEGLDQEFLRVRIEQLDVWRHTFETIDEINGLSDDGEKLSRLRGLHAAIAALNDSLDPPLVNVAAMRKQVEAMIDGFDQ